LCALLLGAARVAYALSDADVAGRNLAVVFFGAAIVNTIVYVELKRRMSGQPGEGYARGALAVLVVGGLGLVGAFEVSSASEAISTAVAGVCFAALPASVLLATRAVARLRAVPAWALGVGVAGTVGQVAMSVYRGLPFAAPPGSVLAALHGTLGLMVFFFWVALWAGLSKESFVPRASVVVGLAFLTAGLFSILSFAGGFLDVHSTILLHSALGTTQIVVGRGVLLGHRTSRRWAYAWLLLWVLAAGGVAIWSTLESASVTVTVALWSAQGARAVPWVWTLCAVVVVWVAALALALHSRAVTDYVEWSEGVRAEWAARAVDARQPATESSRHLSNQGIERTPSAID
jgi:hypothetical protein